MHWSGRQRLAPDTQDPPGEHSHPEEHGIPTLIGETVVWLTEGSHPRQQLKFGLSPFDKQVLSIRHRFARIGWVQLAVSSQMSSVQESPSSVHD